MLVHDITFSHSPGGAVVSNGSVDVESPGGAVVSPGPIEVESSSLVVSNGSVDIGSSGGSVLSPENESSCVNGSTPMGIPGIDHGCLTKSVSNIMQHVCYNIVTAFLI